MKKQNYRAEIKAPREKVWDILWGKDSYPKWTAAFSENSNVITDWEEGSKAIFTDGSGNGMVARIAEKRVPEYLSIQHMGMLKDGKEIMEGPEVEGWAGAEENYTLKEENGITLLDIDIDVNENWKEYFDKTWPTALAKLKELSEN
ncbi:MAG: SRPBCC domain-containing protein [Chitinophagaceae bacterium]|nr:MAG: SRPBCC domain-containing protein [Chitinophagaceae bacterium]